MPTWAIIGASGFIGLRLVAHLHGRDGIAVRPVVRAPSSLAVLARQRLDWRIAPPVDARALAPALAGADVCVQAAIGDAGQIVAMARAAYEACAAAGVRRLVWLSSAAVHGQAPAPGTDEASPLHERHALAYNNAKVRAERVLERCAADRRVEVVRLRPGIVFGPRSRWLTDTARALDEGRAAWIDGGSGICNTIHVDNLAEAVRLAGVTPAAAGEAFLVGDRETVTWREFLLAIAARLDRGPEAFADVPAPAIRPERDSLRARLVRTPLYRLLGDAIPPRGKRLADALLRAWPAPVRPAGAWRLRRPPAPALTAETALLQQCRWKLPHAKAGRLLGYRAEVSFADGMASSLRWLDFVRDRDLPAAP